MSWSSSGSTSFSSSPGSVGRVQHRRAEGEERGTRGRLAPRTVPSILTVGRGSIAAKRPFVRTRTSPLNSKTQREHSLAGGSPQPVHSWNDRMALTVDPSRRALRALNAAQAKRLAGALDTATVMAAVAERGPLQDLHRAQLDILLGQIAFARHRSNEVSPRMLKAAARLGGFDVGLAGEAYLEAWLRLCLLGPPGRRRERSGRG